MKYLDTKIHVILSRIMGLYNNTISTINISPKIEVELWDLACIANTIMYLKWSKKKKGIEKASSAVVLHVYIAKHGRKLCSGFLQESSQVLNIVLRTMVLQCEQPCLFMIALNSQFVNPWGRSRNVIRLRISQGSAEK